MIDVKALEKNETNPETGLGYQEAYKANLQNRGSDPSIVDQILEVNKKRKQLISEAETAKAEQNKMGPEIARLKKSGEDASALMGEMQKMAGAVKEKMKKAEEIKEELDELLMTIPNLCHHTVPVGRDEGENLVVRIVGEPTEFSFEAKEHHDLGENLGILDFESAGKVTGSRFTFLKGAGAQLERAVAMFMLDTHSHEHGYTEVIPPYIVNSDSLRGTGQFPKFKEDVFHLAETDYYLIPTSEVPVTNIFRDQILDEEQLPITYTAFSPNFRSEAGSYGKDTKGLIRQHQFHKVELVHFVHPTQSEEAHEKLTGHAENILKKLELPYRVSSLCTGDIGFAATKCYDLEVWLPGQKAYREISSCSNFWDFQARRANIRFKSSGKKEKPQFVHTLNGSGLAVGRTVVAIMENYQREDGSIEVPKVLQPYMGGRTAINKVN